MLGAAVLTASWEKTTNPEFPQRNFRTSRMKSEILDTQAPGDQDRVQPKQSPTWSGAVLTAVTLMYTRRNIPSKWVEISLRTETAAGGQRQHKELDGKSRTEKTKYKKWKFHYMCITADWEREAEEWNAKKDE